MNSNVEALIAEVRSDLSKYADAHLLDEDSMYRDIVLGLKKFGNDEMELHETVVQVEDGYADLPKSFFELYLAARCEPAGYTTSCDSEDEIHDLQSSHFYKERTTYSRKWSECDNCCETLEENTVRENLYFKRKKLAEFRYDSPKLLSLGKTFNRNNCHSSCRNMLVRDNPDQIVIVKYRLQANFNEGSIYLQYYGLPIDENGNIDIPESKNGNLEEYLEYRLKRKAAERLIGNNDASGLANLYKSYLQQEQVHLKNASNELKMTRIQPKETMRRWKRLNRLESLQFESAFTRMFN